MILSSETLYATSHFPHTLLLGTSIGDAVQESNAPWESTFTLQEVVSEVKLSIDVSIYANSLHTLLKYENSYLQPTWVVLAKQHHGLRFFKVANVDTGV